MTRFIIMLFAFALGCCFVGLLLSPAEVEDKEGVYIYNHETKQIEHLTREEYLSRPITTLNVGE